MATHESARKASRQADKRAIHNQALRARARTGVKKLRALVASDKVNEKEVTPLFNQIQAELMKNAQKGIIKPNAASRTISRLSSAISAKLK